MAHNESAGVTLVQVLEERAECRLLRRRAGIVGLTADVKAALIAHTDGVQVVGLAFYVAVGADHPFRTTWFDLSVTTDDVVVTDTEVETPFAVPTVDLGDGRCLVWPDCTTMNHDKCYCSHTLLIRSNWWFPGPPEWR